MMRSYSFKWVAVGLGAVILNGSAIAQPAPELAAAELSGQLPDGTPYTIRKPAAWNGVLINDLDFVRVADGPRAAHFLSRGYALSGTNRRADRRQRYDPAREIDNLVAVIDLFEQRFGAPRRVLQYGSSGGGHVALAIAEKRPDKVDGAIATCAHTPILNVGIRYDLLTVLKALLAPQDERLTFAGLPADSGATVAHWADLLTAASRTREGQAQIALAFTIVQWSPWTTGSPPTPDLADPEALARSVAETTAGLAERLVAEQYMYERQGIPTGTAGADYMQYWANADPRQRAAVEALYASAGLNLQTSLAAVSAAPRVGPDPGAAAHWLQQPARTVRGKPQVPVFRMHTSGDGVTMIAQTQVYGDIARQNGLAHLYRYAVVERTGHCTFTVAESAAAVEAVMRRLDNGRWPDTGPEALNALGRSLATRDEPRFVRHVLRPFNGRWRLDEVVGAGAGLRR